MLEIQEVLNSAISERWLEMNEKFSKQVIVEWDRLYDSGEGRVFCFADFIGRRKKQLWDELASRN